jgi:hypothetical protein
MNSLIAASLWIALVTVVPGLVTIATLFGTFAYVNPDHTFPLTPITNEWLWGAVAVAIMVLTQAVGILLEGTLVDRRWLGPERIAIGDGLPDTSDISPETVRPYEEYEHLYLLLVRLEDSDDAYGHLERAVAQFFLTNNTLVAFGIGIVATLGVLVVSMSTQVVPEILFRGTLYVGILLAALVVSYHVAVIRFRVMALSIWSLRKKPLHYRHAVATRAS